MSCYVINTYSTLFQSRFDSVISSIVIALGDVRRADRMGGDIETVLKLKRIIYTLSYFHRINSGKTKISTAKRA